MSFLPRRTAQDLQRRGCGLQGIGLLPHRQSIQWCAGRVLGFGHFAVIILGLLIGWKDVLVHLLRILDLEQHIDQLDVNHLLKQWTMTSGSSTVSELRLLLACFPS